MPAADPVTVSLYFKGGFVYLHGVSAIGKRVVQRRIRRMALLDTMSRLYPCTVAIEADPAAHHWARMITDQGRKVLLVPESSRGPMSRGTGARPHRRAAEACRAALDRTVNFLPIMALAEQAKKSASDCCDLLHRQRGKYAEVLRSHLERYGIFLGRGAAERPYPLATVEDDGLDLLPPPVRAALRPLADQIRACGQSIMELETGSMDRATERGLRIPKTGGTSAK